MADVYLQIWKEQALVKMLNPRLLMQYFDHVKMGMFLYESYLEELPENVDIIFAPGHLGDTVWACALSGAYKARRQRKVLYLVHESLELIPALFPDVDYFLALENSVYDSLLNYVCVDRKYKEEHFYLAQRLAHFLLGNEGSSFSMKLSLAATETLPLGHIFKELLDLPYDAPISRPQIPPVTEEIRHRFANAVLLCPGSSSIKGIPVSFWQRVGRLLQGEGLEVLINDGGLPYDMAVEGFSPLRCNLQEIAQLGPCMKLCIGIRSGLFDWLAMTEARLLVLAPRIAMDKYLPEKMEDTPICMDEDARDPVDIRDLGRDRGIWSYWYHPAIEDRLIAAILDLLHSL